MSDNYQAVYDAVRSRMDHCHVNQAVENVLSNCNFSFYAERAAQGVIDIFEEHRRPGVLFRPKLSIDGDMWCALYGDNLQDGVAGFGESPEKAMWDFDKNWATNLKKPIKEPTK